MYSPEQLDTIRRLNDAARQSPGVTSCANVTQGFLALPDADCFKAVSAIVGFTKFDGDNDPYGEHDFGAVYRLASGEWSQERPSDGTAISETVFWKVDYYDNTLTYGSEAPWDAQQTTRVLTVMLASEY
ncbi:MULTISPECIES: DUF3768 domain-containing protein [Sphingomonadales]|jgi:hypothetical protein|uniref:DUF3768 domain-containing protein n=4 Tax=Sphingomonadaceae TaxID=41297 RepID=A0A7W6PWV7_9SPHN|nr:MULTISPECIES: DUF3768 domain-containing protein [Sphingomonadaceae]KFD28043.1 hypothetical protein IH86_11505 [Sphingobium yanoikuyae]MBB4149549.1 hypothetical protein [Sphingobium scionense]MDV3480926.1 DUF3768 domain-containing protein [Sphingobium yanoikuyae]TKV44068.1 hypothetical protein A0U87_10325 [Sphingobium sp. MP9-4]SMP75755.1 Protein of unknown function [Novosphingobium panipatense]